jgi:hypothetical protein
MNEEGVAALAEDAYDYAVKRGLARSALRTRGYLHDDCASECARGYAM